MFKIGEMVTNVFGGRGQILESYLNRFEVDRFCYTVLFESGEMCTNIEERYLKRGYAKMTKSDLKTGMMVKFKNETSGIILKDTEDGDIVSMNGIYRKLADWNEDLSHGKISNLDIDGIWGNDVPDGCLFFDDARWSLKELIKSTKELTIDEIEKKLGYKIKIVNRF